MTKRPAICIGFAVLLVLSCQNIGRLLPGSNDDPVADADLDRDQTLFLLGGQPRTLDPAITRGGASGPIGAIFNGLVALDSNLQVRPELAAGWDVADGGATYTFYLRHDAVFHDGRPVTAQDVVFSWERAADPSIESDTVLTYLGDVVGLAQKKNGQADRIEGLRLLDDYTLEVRIDAPKVYFLSKLTYPVAFVVDRDNVDQPDWERQPNGAGAFRLQSWKDDEILILARNERYLHGAPDVSHLVYLIGAGIPLSMYERDEIDLVGVGGDTLARVQDPNDELFPDLRVGVDMCSHFISFNTVRPPFDDPLVRQAFTHALDREKLVDGVFRGHALAASGPLPPGMPGYTGEASSYDFDPARARELLAQAGYGDAAQLPAITYTTAGYGSAGGLVTAIITMWQENLGVAVEPLLLDPFLYLDELYAGNVGHIFGHGWCADYPDPENFLDVLFHSASAQNLGGYANPAVDDMLEQARVQSDVATRLAQYGQIERLIVADAPAVFLAHSLSAVLVKPRLQNYVLTPIGVAQWHEVTLAR